MNISKIPQEIINLAIEAISPQNDGFTKKAATDRLVEIRDYINNILEKPVVCGGDDV